MKNRRSLTFWLLTLMLASLLVACGDSATNTPATGNTTAAGNSTSASSGDAAKIIQSSQNALLAVKDYQGSIDFTFTGQGAGTLSMDTVLKGSLVSTDEGGAAPQFKGTVTKSTLLTVPSGMAAALGKDVMIYDPGLKVVLKGTNSAFSEVYSLFLGSQTKIITLYSSDLAVPTLAGDEKVGNYNTTKLTFVPKAGLEGTSAFGKGAKGTVWIDKDTNIPVQLDYSEEGGGMKWVMNSFSINKGVTDAQLAFQAPADAKVVDMAQFGKLTKVTSLDEAKAQAGFTFPGVGYLPADLPKTPSSIGIQTTPVGNLIIADYSVKSAIQNVTPFANAKGKTAAVSEKGISIQVLKSTTGLPANIPSGAALTQVTIQGQNGLVAVMDKLAMVTFQKDGMFFTLSSNSYGKDDLLKVAEGLK